MTDSGGQGTVETPHNQETSTTPSVSQQQQQQQSSQPNGEKAESGSGLTVSNCLLSSGGEKTEENDTAECQTDPSDLPQPSEMKKSSQNKKAEQSDSEIYDPENPGEASDDENLVIDDSSTDQNNIPSSHNGSEATDMKDSKPNKIRISLTTTTATLGHPQTPSKKTP